MKFYQAVEVDEETPVQWLAVHPLRWKTAEWGEPAIMFREVDDETQTLADAAPGLLAACEAALEMAEYISCTYGRMVGDTSKVQSFLSAAIAIAKVTTDTDD